MTVFKKSVAFCILIVLIFSAFMIFKDPILFEIGDYLVIEDHLSSSDVIHVIAGEDYRTDHAIWLFNQGYAKQIFFTGGWCEIHKYNHGQHGLERAFTQGIPKQAIAYDETPVMSTYDEAVRLKVYIDNSQSPIHSVIVVSDPFHMRRALWTYRRVLGKEIEVLLAPVPFEQTPYQERWWEDFKSKTYLKDEYIKFVYYILRYQLSRGAVNAWLASLDRQ